jgi:hypothetical protein
MKNKILTQTIVILFAMMFFSCTAFAAENTNHKITSGSFGVAWIDNNGNLYVNTGQTKNNIVATLKTFAVAAADVLGEGQDQLIYIDADKKSMFIKSFKTDKLLGPFGNNIKTLATGQFKEDENFASVLVSTVTSEAWRWTREIMEKGWEPFIGDFEQITAGKSKPSNKFDDFAVVSAGNVYLFSPKWKTYSQLIEGKEIVAALYGNVTPSPGDELVLLDKKGNLFLYQNGGVEDLGIQNVQDFTFGKNGGGLDTLYVALNNGTLSSYNRETKQWGGFGGFSTQVSGYRMNLITQTNVENKNEGHLLYVADSNNFLWKVNSDIASIVQKSEPDSIWLRGGDQKAGEPVNKDGHSLAEYKYKNVPAKPYISVLKTPSGENVLRDSPHDHKHHHALMFALAVNGVNFWGEDHPKRGRQMTTTLTSNVYGVSSELNWIDSENKILLKESRAIHVTAQQNVTLLDWQSTLNALDKPVEFDKSAHHYYGLGLRFDESMDHIGRFFNSSGQQGEIVRGDERLTPCHWMAYTSKLHGKPVTVAVLGDPKNPVPTLAFTMGEAGKVFAYMGISLNFHREPRTLKANESLTFRFRVAVWDGEVSPKTVENAYQDYVNVKY